MSRTATLVDPISILSPSNFLWSSIVTYLERIPLTWLPLIVISRDTVMSGREMSILSSLTETIEKLSDFLVLCKSEDLTIS